MSLASRVLGFAASLAHNAGLPNVGAALGMPRPRGYRPSRAESLRYVGVETVERCADVARHRAAEKWTRRALRGAR